MRPCLPGRCLRALLGIRGRELRLLKSPLLWEFLCVRCRPAQEECAKPLGSGWGFAGGPGARSINGCTRVCVNTKAGLLEHRGAWNSKGQGLETETIF